METSTRFQRRTFGYVMPKTGVIPAGGRGGAGTAFEYILSISYQRARLSVARAASEHRGPGALRRPFESSRQWSEASR